MIFLRRLVLTAMAVLVAVNPVLADTKINQVPTVGNINPTDSLMIMRPDVSAPGGTALKQVPLSLLLSAGSSSASAAKLAAPPTTGTWKLNDVVYNSAPAPGAAYAWICVTAGTPGVWAPVATIGAALASTAPTQYTISLLSPASNATVTGITTFSIQAPGLKNVELWDANKTKLAGGAPGSDATGALTLSYDTNNLPNGPANLSLNGWDVPAWTNGGNPPDQQPTHSASLPVSVTVSNNASASPVISSLTIMGIGDSITAGDGGAGQGYRPELKSKLNSLGFTVSYVGSQTDGTYAHEGYPGKGVDDVKGYINTNNILAVNPNVIVLEIGTNDNSGYSGALNSSTYSVFNSGTQALLNEFGTLLDLIHTKVPNAYVFVSNLLPRTGGMAVPEDAFNKGPVTGYTSGIASLISAKSSSSFHVYLVDDNSNFPSSTGLADGLHPNDSVGYPWLGDQIAGVINNALKSSGGTGATSPPSSSITAPAPAVSAGFTSLVFDDEMDSISTFDVNGTRAAGFKWYFDRPFGWSTLSGSCVSVQNGYATIKCDGTGPNYSIASVGSSGSSWQGFAQGGGGYFEARIRFNASTRGSTGGWPSFWTMSAEHLFGGNGTRWFESDFMEFLMWNFGGSATAYGATTHDWPGGTQDLHQAEGASDGNWHVFGAAWKPATSSTSGYVKYYLDGNLVGTTTWSQGGTYSVGDTHHMPVILGTDTNWPMDVDYVRVWH